LRADAVRVRASWMPLTGRRFRARVVRVYSSDSNARAGVGSRFKLEGRAEPDSMHTGPMWFSYVTTDGRGTHGACCMHQTTLGHWRGTYLRVVNADHAQPTLFSLRNIRWVRADEVGHGDRNLATVTAAIRAVPRGKIPDGWLRTNRRLVASLQKRLLNTPDQPTVDSSLMPDNQLREDAR
ncbi:MAG: hypothetical protein SGI92_31915, partial [Bryobacteraceae bacterium]|nr:hypothetical protein [Bryobacteraceae bacterium]